MESQSITNTFHTFHPTYGQQVFASLCSSLRTFLVYTVLLWRLEGPSVRCDDMIAIDDNPCPFPCSHSKLLHTSLSIACSRP